MTDPVISPDGKWMWTGAEWIPAPPTAESVSVSMQDSVIAGDVNITQNNAEDIATAMVQALERMGFSGQSTPAELTPSQEKEVGQVLEMSEQLAVHGIEIDPWTEINLGSAAVLIAEYEKGMQHFSTAERKAMENNDKMLLSSVFHGQADIYRFLGFHEKSANCYRKAMELRESIGEKSTSHIQGLAVVALNQGKFSEAAELFHQVIQLEEEVQLLDSGESNLANAYRGLSQLEISLGNYEKALYYENKGLEVLKEEPNPERLANAFNGLGIIAKKRGDLAEAERLYRESLAIRREIGDRNGEAHSLVSLGNIMNSKGQYDEQRRLNTEAVRIWREIGIPVDQWYIDNGY
jgi:tetratricopeptide (TPR) repeat protein